MVRHLWTRAALPRRGRKQGADAPISSVAPPRARRRPFPGRRFLSPLLTPLPASTSPLRRWFQGLCRAKTEQSDRFGE